MEQLAGAHAGRSARPRASPGARGVVTKRESDEPSAEGLGRHLGSRQETGEDPWERYRRAGWNPDDFTPLGAALP